MTLFKRQFSNRIEKGTWRPVDFDGRMSAILFCPKCGQSMTILDHHIADDGTVTPSVVGPSIACANSRCDFHDFVKLELWNPIGNKP